MDVGFNEAPTNAQVPDLSGVGVAANADAGGVQGIGGSIPMTPAAQAQAGVTDAKTGPDWKGMAKGLGEGLTAYQKAQAPIKAQGLYQQAKAPQPMPMGVAANQTAGAPQGVSGAMQAIMQGIPEQQRKMGILGMRERVNFIGGEFSINSKLGKGTTVSVKVPYKSNISINQPSLSLNLV